MASTSCNELAEEALARCLAGEPAPVEWIQRLVDEDCHGALFGILVEGLADRFEPRLCDVYADLFSAVLERLIPTLSGIRARYERIRRPRVCELNPERVYVLSRVTLGADIAVTSVLLDAAKKRFPEAEIYLAGSAKAAELFAGDSRIRHHAVSYPRTGTLQQRLSTWTRFDHPNCVVIDPDSRLTQLGLLPVCEEERYLFFESRAFGGDSTEGLSGLAARWARETLGVEARAYIAPERVARECEVAVSLGVGENPAKRVEGEFETRLLARLAERAGSVMVDLGGGGEEGERVRRAIEGAFPGGRASNISTWNGSFAGFADIVSRCRLYVGYDSAGQHAAAAAGVPQVTIFRGHVNQRMLQRWSPANEKALVLENLVPEELLRIFAELPH